jgi:hypothetical protein
VVEKEWLPPRIVVRGQIYGLAGDVRAADLIRLARWALNEAAQLEVEEAARNSTAKEG